MKGRERGPKSCSFPHSIPVSTSELHEMSMKPFNDTFFKADWSSFSSLYQVIPVRVVNKQTHNSSGFAVYLAVQRVTCFHIQICLLQCCPRVDSVGVQWMTYLRCWQASTVVCELTRHWKFQRKGLLPPCVISGEVGKHVSVLRYHSDKHYVTPEREIEITKDDEC